GVPLVEALGDGEDGVELVALGGEELAATLLAVDEDDEIVDDEPRLLEHRDGLELAAAVRDDVVDEHDAVSGLVDALDAPLRPVALLLLPGIDQREIASEARGDGQGQPPIGNTRHAIAGPAADLRGPRQPAGPWLTS